MSGSNGNIPAYGPAVTIGLSVLGLVGSAVATIVGSKLIATYILVACGILFVTGIIWLLVVNIQNKIGEGL